MNGCYEIENTVHTVMHPNVNKLENIFHKNEVVSQDMVRTILDNMGLSELVALSSASKSWKEQVNPLMGRIRILLDLPRWIDVQHGCGAELLKEYEVPEDEQPPIPDEIWKVYEEDIFSSNHRFNARMKYMMDVRSFQISLFVHAAPQDNHFLEIKQLQHKLQGVKNLSLENFLGKKIEIKNLDTSSSLIFRLTFDRVDSLDPLIIYKRTGGKARCVLRLKALEMISEAEKKQGSEKTINLFNQKLQSLNEKEDNKFIESLSAEPLLEAGENLPDEEKRN